MEIPVKKINNGSQNENNTKNNIYTHIHKYIYVCGYDQLTP